MTTVSIEIQHACDCVTCGTPVVMGARMNRARREDGATFYCPNGHAQHFGDAPITKLQKQVEDYRARWKSAAMREADLEDKNARLKQRNKALRDASKACAGAA